MSLCPLCPGNEAQTPPEILAYRANDKAPNTPGWHVRVVPNKFPALQIEGELGREGLGLYDRMNGVGAHEVIIESSEHKATLATAAVVLGSRGHAARTLGSGVPVEL